MQSLLVKTYDTIKLIINGRFASFEGKYLQEEILMLKCKNIVQNICCFIFEEYYMSSNSDLKSKLQAYVESMNEVRNKHNLLNCSTIKLKSDIF
jgi:hypothetical protein